MKKNNLITLLIILVVIAVAIFILVQSPPETPESIAKCIGENSVLYVKLGCHACETQEELFGESLSQITRVDCFYDMDRCIEESITATPTWIINGQKVVGVQSIEKLKELTGC